MNSDEIYEVVEEIGRASGNARHDVLKQYMPNANFKEVMIAALCPFTTYGVKKMPIMSMVPQGKKYFDSDTWQLLSKLKARKLTGNAAQQAIKTELEQLTVASATLLERILTKDLRAGITAKSINKVAPGTIITFECMLAHKFEEKRIRKWPVAVEPKFDGVRALCIFKDGEARFFSRTGKEFLALQELGSEIAKELTANEIDMDLVLDGEIMDKSGSFNKIVGDVHKKDIQLDNAVFNVFDIMSLEAFNTGGSMMEYQVRRKTLANLMLARLGRLVALGLMKMVPVTYCHDHDHIMEVYSEIRAVGGEGVIVKPLTGVYVSKRSHDWLKIKDQQSVDVPIIGFQEGTGKYEGLLGALIVDYNGVAVNVGSGLDDASRIEIWDKQDELMGMLVEVEYHEETAGDSPSLRHPRFVRFRSDKQEAA